MRITIPESDASCEAEAPPTPIRQSETLSETGRLVVVVPIAQVSDERL